MLRAVAVARLLLPNVNIQAPPNLSAPYYEDLVDAGINDWGGISPLTPDFINPEKPWPHLEQLRLRTEAKGIRTAPASAGLSGIYSARDRQARTAVGKTAQPPPTIDGLAKTEGGMICVLSGGTGGAKFVDGLRQVMPAEEITLVVNTGDDLLWWGLYVSPDIDSITYVLSGMLSRERGWGVKGDTFLCLQAMGQLGEPTWFHTGDRDLAMHLLRSRLLAEGKTLSEATAVISEKLGVKARILPMSDSRVETRVDTPVGELSFEEYFVQRWYQDPVNSVRFAGASDAEPAPGVIDAIISADAVLIAPSNPVTSIGPILAVPGIREALLRAAGKIAAVSPIVGNAPVAGPAGILMAAQGLPCSIAGVAQAYEDFLDVLVCDTRDARAAETLRNNGLRVQCTQTIMRTAEDKAALAREVLSFVSAAAQGRTCLRRCRSTSGPAAVILVPVKNLSSAKQRLAAVLDQPSRTELAQAMLHDVLTALHDWKNRPQVALVTSDPYAVNLAARIRIRNHSRPRQSRRNRRDRDGHARLRRARSRQHARDPRRHSADSVVGTRRNSEARAGRRQRARPRRRRTRHQRRLPPPRESIPAPLRQRQLQTASRRRASHRQTVRRAESARELPSTSTIPRTCTSSCRSPAKPAPSTSPRIRANGNPRRRDGATLRASNACGTPNAQHPARVRSID